jgi:hypothetical protein
MSQNSVVTRWLDDLRAWQFALISGCFVLLAMVVGDALVDSFTGLHGSVGAFLPVAIVVAISNAGTATWARQRRLGRLSSRQHVGTPGQMRLYRGADPRDPAIHDQVGG